jgi:hypothetical protein
MHGPAIGQLRAAIPGDALDVSTTDRDLRRDSPFGGLGDRLRDGDLE